MRCPSMADYCRPLAVLAFVDLVIVGVTTEASFVVRASGSPNCEAGATGSFGTIDLLDGACTFHVVPNATENVTAFNIRITGLDAQ